MIDSKKIKIAFLLGRVTGKGGISRVTSILTETLANQEYVDSVHIISFHKKDEITYGWSDNLKYYDLLNNRPNMRKGFIKGVKNLVKYLKLNKIDVLVATGHNVGPISIVASWFTSTKIVYWSHSSFKASTNSKFRIINEKFTAYFGKGIITLTKEDELNYRSETKAKLVEQIYNPVDPKLIDTKKTYNKKSKQIISVGRLTHQKNFSTLIDVAKIVFANNMDWEWHIFGSGEEETNLKNKIIENSLESHVKLKGHSNNIYDQYEDYSFIVMTSIYEGFPMTLIEGMANNLPLVSFDIPTGPNEIIRENINGFLIKPFDIEKMAEKINFLIKNEKSRKSMAVANSNYINDFNMHKIQKQWRIFFEKVLTL